MEQTRIDHGYASTEAAPDAALPRTVARQDRRLGAFAGLPAWYLPLRLRLGVVACLGLAVGGWSGFWSHPGNLLPVVLT